MKTDQTLEETKTTVVTTLAQRDKPIAAPIKDDFKYGCNDYTEAELEVAKIGKEIVDAHIKVASKYLKLCEHIRTNNIDPATVRILLTPVGFEKSRISEINTVANAAEDKWQAIKAAELGWKRALDTARGSQVMLLASAKLDIAPDSTPESNGMTGEATTEESGTAPANAHDKIEFLFERIANIANKGKIRKVTCTFKDIGYTVEVRKNKATGGDVRKPKHQPE